MTEPDRKWNERNPRASKFGALAVVAVGLVGGMIFIIVKSPNWDNGETVSQTVGLLAFVATGLLVFRHFDRLDRR